MQTKRTGDRLLTPPMIDTSKLAMVPEDDLQMDIVPFDEPSNGYTAVVTAMDVFSGYLFTYCVTRIDGKILARALVDIMTRHAYLPTTIITDKGTEFMSEVMADTLSHCPLSHLTTTRPTTQHSGVNLKLGLKQARLRQHMQGKKFSRKHA